MCDARNGAELQPGTCMPICPSARLLRIIYLIEEDLNTEQIYVHAKRLNQNEEHVYDLTQGYVKCSLGT